MKYVADRNSFFDDEDNIDSDEEESDSEMRKIQVQRKGSNNSKSSHATPQKIKSKKEHKIAEEKHEKEKKEDQWDAVDRSKVRILLSVWIPKGGVGKTTTSFTLAHTLAQRGLRVLLVDCDSQRDVSRICLKERIDDFDEGSNYMSYIGRTGLDENGNVTPAPNRTLHQMLVTMLRRNNPEVSQAVPETIVEETSRGGSLHLLAGHRDMDMWDGEITKWEALIHVLSAQAGLSGAPYHAVMQVADQINADIVLVDLPPGKGAFTRAMLMSSDYFLVPSKADFYSYEAIESLMQRLVDNSEGGQGYQATSWLEYTYGFVIPESADTRYPFPRKIPKFLGYVVSDYRVQFCGEMVQGVASDRTALNTEHWMNIIYCKVKEQAKILRQARLEGHRAIEVAGGATAPMAFKESDYKSLNIVKFLLSKVRNFGQLQSLSHIFGVPVPYLKDEHMVIYNAIGEQTQAQPAEKESRMRRVQQLHQVYDQCAWGILSLIHMDQPNGRIKLPQALHNGGGPTGPPPPEGPKFIDDVSEDGGDSDDDFGSAGAVATVSATGGGTVPSTIPSGAAGGGCSGRRAGSGVGVGVAVDTVTSPPSSSSSSSSSSRRPAARRAGEKSAANVRR